MKLRLRELRLLAVEAVAVEEIAVDPVALVLGLRAAPSAGAGAPLRLRAARRVVELHAPRLGGAREPLRVEEAPSRGVPRAPRRGRRRRRARPRARAPGGAPRAARPAGPRRRRRRSGVSRVHPVEAQGLNGVHGHAAFGAVPAGEISAVDGRIQRRPPANRAVASLAVVALQLEMALLAAGDAWETAAPDVLLPPVGVLLCPRVRALQRPERPLLPAPVVHDPPGLDGPQVERGGGAVGLLVHHGEGIERQLPLDRLHRPLPVAVLDGVSFGGDPLHSVRRDRDRERHREQVGPVPAAEPLQAPEGQEQALDHRDRPDDRKLPDDV
mmetsp:Transcript_32632/g.93139  ORF Transcript_32632/g.93139 Transcript_32632/m.93139 type:complete len:327 (-) Transcript_32632:639-1619(-)